ncbi:unnamed protein product [Caenorhabditis brenneri]
MNSKPVSYETLKSVFKHMDVNKRFHFSFHCPAVQSAEKAAPLFIDSLAYQLRGIKINDTVYELPTSPEDVDFYEKWAVNEEDLNHAIRGKEVLVWGYEWALSCKKKGEGNHFVRIHSLEELQSLLDEARADLCACKNQHAEVAQAMLKLGAYLFGGRRFTIQVNCFETGPYTIRLPEGVMFHIKQLTPHHLLESSESSLRPIIHTSSYPFECIRNIDMDFENWDWAIESAKKIVIYWEHPYCMYTMAKMPYPNVHIVHGKFLPPNNLKMVINTWLVNSPPVGTQLTIDDTEDDKNLKMVMINTSFNVEISTVSPASIPTRNGTNLVISIRKNSNKTGRTWSARLKVEAGAE